jgi:hypothetical protein
MRNNGLPMRSIASRVPKALRSLIHGRSSQWFCFYVVFALPVGQIVAAVENSAKKVLHAMKFKFHDHNSRTREAKHFLNVQRLGTLWHAVCTLVLQQQRNFLPGGVS